MPMILIGTLTIHQVGVSVWELIGGSDSALADTEVFTRVGIVPIMAAGTIHGMLMVDGAAIHTGVAITEDIGVAVTTVEVIGATELQINVFVISEGKTTSEQVGRVL